jgi:hypothetical protein
MKDEDKLTFIEKLIKEELIEFGEIDREIELLEDAERTKDPEIILPFPMSEKYKQELIHDIQHTLKFKLLDGKDTNLFPYEPLEETFDDRLRKIPGVDIDEEIRKSIRFELS